MRNTSIMHLSTW